jgi:transposase
MTSVGLDLHKRYITACALSESGALLAERRRLRPDCATLLEFLAALPQPVTVAMEATLYWAWLHDELATHGYATEVAHAHQVKLIWQARAKTDPIDARKLAELSRVRCFPAIWIADPATRARRTLLRGRAQIVRVRTQLKNRVHGLLIAVNCRWERSDLYGVAGRAWLTTLALPPAVRQQVDVFLELIDELTTRIKRLDRVVLTAARDEPIAAQLQTVPGIGPFSALLILAEIGTVTRFGTSHELAAYAGLTPSTRSSGDKTTHGGVGRAGSPWLKWILIEVVQALKLAPGPIGVHYQHLLRAKGKQKATVAAARKLCCYLYWMLTHGWTYEEWLQQHEDQHELGVRPRQRMGSAA